MSKALIISGDSLSDKTGGGIYLRGITDGIKEEFESTVLVCKKSGGVIAERYRKVRIYELNRHLLSDVFARMFFQASFLVMHLPFILKIIISEKPNVVYIHGTKHGLVVWFVSFVLKIKVILVSDNIELVLFKELYKKKNGFFGKIKLLVDLCCVRISEKLSVDNATVISFITSDDMKLAKEIYGFHQSSLVWPVTIYDDTKFEIKNRSSYALFTGSFRFQPNVDAVNELYELLKDTPCKVIIAGLSASKLNIDFPENFGIVCSPNDDDMRKLFEEALFFVSLVRFGSGMKTKVAEALKFGLPVFGTEHSFIGYEEIFDSGLIYTMKDSSSFYDFMNSIRDNREDISRLAYTTYKKYYSEVRSKKCAKLSFSMS
ncbi:glycosyltransferase family 4 protein [Vibrio navarrensis]|nr:glycosyltransferase family 4 protein [Vibrio navarrensis]